MRPLSFGLLLAACATGGDADSSGDEAPASSDDRPTAYTYTPDDAAGSTFDPAVLEEALDDLVTHLPLVTAQPVLEGYDSVMSSASGGCPTWSEFDGNAFWYGYCTSDDGSYWDGYSFFTVYNDVDLFGDGSSWQADSLSGAATVRRGSDLFHVGGSIADGRGVGPDGSDRWITQLYGSFAWNDPRAADTWLAGGVTPSLLLYAIQYNGVDGGTEGNLFYMDGSISGISDAVSAFSFQQVQAGPRSVGFGCELEPFGTIEIRDHAGAWYSVTFDYDERGAFVGECDGCGAVYKGDKYQGEVCTDTSPLWTWEVAPW